MGNYSLAADHPVEHPGEGRHLEWVALLGWSRFVIGGIRRVTEGLKAPSLSEESGSHMA